MSAVNYLAAALFWRWSGKESGTEVARLKNPFELGPALLFAGLLAALMLLSKALSDRYGDTGIYLLSAASGLADVDAITLSLANMASEDLATSAAALAILIAAFVNASVKAGLATGIGGLRLGSRVGVSTLLVVVTGLATWWALP